MVQHFVEGLLYEYRATVRSKATLIDSMDEVQKIQKRLVVRDGTTRRSGEERTWEGLYEASKKKGSPR